MTKGGRVGGRKLTSRISPKRLQLEKVFYCHEQVSVPDAFPLGFKGLVGLRTGPDDTIVGSKIWMCDLTRCQIVTTSSLSQHNA